MNILLKRIKIEQVFRLGSTQRVTFIQIFNVRVWLHFRARLFVAAIERRLIDNMTPQIEISATPNRHATAGNVQAGVFPQMDQFDTPDDRTLLGLIQLTLFRLHLVPLQQKSPVGVGVERGDEQNAIGPLTIVRERVIDIVDLPGQLDVSHLGNGTFYGSTFHWRSIHQTFHFTIRKCGRSSGKFAFRGSVYIVVAQNGSHTGPLGFRCRI